MSEARAPASPPRSAIISRSNSSPLPQRGSSSKSGSPFSPAARKTVLHRLPVHLLSFEDLSEGEEDEEISSVSPRSPRSPSKLNAMNTKQGAAAAAAARRKQQQQQRVTALPPASPSTQHILSSRTWSPSFRPPTPVEKGFKLKPEDLDFHSRLAEGTYGVVWRATLTREGKNDEDKAVNHNKNNNKRIEDVAVKVQRIPGDEQEQANLLIELSILQGLIHPRLVRYYGAALLDEKEARARPEWRPLLSTPSDAAAGTGTGTSGSTGNSSTMMAHLTGTSPVAATYRKEDKELEEEGNEAPCQSSVTSDGEKGKIRMIEEADDLPPFVTTATITDKTLGTDKTVTAVSTPQTASTAMTSTASTEGSSSTLTMTATTRLPHPGTMVLIAMEYCVGGSLRHGLQQANFSWPLKVRVSSDVAEGLAFLHANGIMHRDLKTTNILLDRNWRAKICDHSYAIAHMSPDIATYTCGTMEFISPEVALNEPYDTKCDMFSFGVVICEMVTEKEPGQDDFLCRRSQDLFQLDAEQVEAAVLPDCPPSFVALALHCAQQEPSDRPSAIEAHEWAKSLLHELNPSPAALVPDEGKALTPRGHRDDEGDDEEREDEEEQNGEGGDNQQEEEEHRRQEGRSDSDKNGSQSHSESSRQRQEGHVEAKEEEEETISSDSTKNSTEAAAEGENDDKKCNVSTSESSVVRCSTTTSTIASISVPGTAAAPASQGPSAPSLPSPSTCSSSLSSSSSTNYRYSGMKRPYVKPLPSMASSSRTVSCDGTPCCCCYQAGCVMDYRNPAPHLSSSSFQRGSISTTSSNSGSNNYRGGSSGGGFRGGGDKRRRRRGRGGGGPGAAYAHYNTGSHNNSNSGPRYLSGYHFRKNLLSATGEAAKGVPTTSTASTCVTGATATSTSSSSKSSSSAPAPPPFTSAWDRPLSWSSSKSPPASSSSTTSPSPSSSSSSSPALSSSLPPKAPLPTTTTNNSSSSSSSTKTAGLVGAWRSAEAPVAPSSTTTTASSSSAPSATVVPTSSARTVTGVSSAASSTSAVPPPSSSSSSSLSTPSSSSAAAVASPPPPATAATLELHRLIKEVEELKIWKQEMMKDLGDSGHKNSTEGGKSEGQQEKEQSPPQGGQGQREERGTVDEDEEKPAARVAAAIAAMAQTAAAECANVRDTNTASTRTALATPCLPLHDDEIVLMCKILTDSWERQLTGVYQKFQGHLKELQDEVSGTQDAGDTVISEDERDDEKNNKRTKKDTEGDTESSVSDRRLTILKKLESLHNVLKDELQTTVSTVERNMSAFTSKLA